MERLKQRLSLTQKALDAFKQILTMTPNPIVRDAAIQRFEFTFEATWKLAQLYLRENEGLEVNSPKSVFRHCFQVGLLPDEKQTAFMLKMVDDRNLTVHTYNEQLAEQIYSNLNNYYDLLYLLFNNIINNVR